MTPEIILTAVSASSVLAHFLAERRWAKERAGLVRALVAKNAGELVMLERAADPVKRAPKTEQHLPIGL